MKREKIVSFLNSPRFYATIFIVSFAQFTLAQPSPVSFQVDGSVSVTNDVLHLQTTAMLNLMELYRLPSSPNLGQGILMWTSPAYGPNAKVEVRVYDYDEERKSKGMLIYAVSGTKSGWNKDEWDASSSMFTTDAKFSDKLQDRFNFKIGNNATFSTTNIKVLSQFAGLGSICDEPGSVRPIDNEYSKGVLGGRWSSMVYFGGMASARARRDDDDDDDDCGLNSPPQNNPALNQAKKKLEEAKADVEKALSNLTVAFNKASVAEAKAKAYEKDAENLTGRVEQAVTWLDAVKENVREKAKNYLSRVQEAANARADMADAEGVAEKAAQKASDMKNSAKAYKAEAKKNRQIADELKRLAEIAEDTYEEDEGVALLLEWQYTVALEQHKASLGGGNTFGNAIEDLDLAMMKIKVDAAKAKAKYSQFQYNKAKRKFKEADQTATLAEQLAKNAEQIAKLAQASAEKAKKEAADARAAAQAADQAVTDADQELVRAMAAQSDAERKLAFVTNEAEIATALVELARNDVERAVEKVKEAQKALTDAQKKLKASAEVVEALQFPDDDDDNPGVPPIVPVTHYVADPELNPYSFINASNAFGKSYLFGEQYYDDLLFHNPSITEQGKLDFQDHFLTCAARAFEKEPCDLLSPMPVVLIEVVIRNAELRAIKIPGLPEISAGLLQSALPLYDNELNAHYINVTAADQYITSNGYKVIEADFPEQVHPIGFPKYDHVKVPDFNNSPSQEFKTDNWNRTILAGTYNALSGLQKQLEARASAADVDAEEYFSITHMSHEFMKVKKVPEGNDVLTYELWSLTLNKEFVSKFNATVTAEGPFEVSNGLSDTKPLHEWQDNEIFVRAATKDLSIADNAVEAAIENGAIKIYPNPAREIVHIEFTLLRKSPVRLRFFDMFGNIIYDEEEMLDAGVHHKTINDVKNFHPGMYVVVISANFEQQVSRIAIE